MTAREELFRDNPELRREYEIESLLGRVSDLLEIAISESNLTKQEAAHACGISPGRVSQLISGEENLTLRVIAETSFALGYRFTVDLDPIIAVAASDGDRHGWRFGQIEIETQQAATDESDSLLAA